MEMYFKELFHCGLVDISGEVSPSGGPSAKLTHLGEALSCSVRMLDMVNVFLVDEEYRILFWPEMLEKLYGYNKVEAYKNNVFELLMTSPVDSMMELRRALSCGEEWRGEYKHKKRSGEDVYVVSHWVKIKASLSDGFLFIVDEADVSNMKKLEEVNNLSFNMMKHDIKSPLGGIVSAS
ncbi:MAG: PAS domain-containing protein, partial [Thermodesulfobacteriota bacterium]